jgi:hypothetical protein
MIDLDATLEQLFDIADKAKRRYRRTATAITSPRGTGTGEGRPINRSLWTAATTDHRSSLPQVTTTNATDPYQLV